MSEKKRTTRKVETGIYSMEPDKPNKRCFKWLLYVPRPKDGGDYKQKKKVFYGSLTEAKRERSRLLVAYGNKPRIRSDVTWASAYTHSQKNAPTPGTIRKERWQPTTIAPMLPPTFWEMYVWLTLLPIS